MSNPRYTKAEATDEKLLELQNSIQGVERKLRLTDTEKKADVDEGDSNRKKNDLEIKRLKMEVQELEVRLQRCQKADESMISKEFQKHFRDVGNFTGKLAKEIIRELESELLELQRQSQRLKHELETRARTLRHSEEQLGEMARSCDSCFENEPTECHSLQYIRELENEHQKISKYVTESEVAASVFKEMKSQLEKNQLSNVHLLQAVEREHEILEQATAVDDEINIRQSESETKKEVRFLESENPKLSELQEMQVNLEKIREATGVTEIQEVETRFLEQQSTGERLSDLKKRLSKTLQDLRAEKRQLDSKRELLQGAGCPERELGEEVSAARCRLHEQERRKERTTMELEGSSALLAALHGRTRDLLRKVQPFLRMEINPNMTTVELIMKLEEIVRKSEKFLPQ